MLTAGSVFQAEKGCHTQLALWIYGERSQVNSHIMNSVFYFFIFLLGQKIYDWRDCIKDINKKENAGNVRAHSNDEKKGGNELLHTIISQCDLSLYAINR